MCDIVQNDVLIERLSSVYVLVEQSNHKNKELELQNIRKTMKEVYLSPLEKIDAMSINQKCDSLVDKYSCHSPS